MMLGNKKRWVNKPGNKNKRNRVRKVEDFDGVSLFASAQKRLGAELGGYLMGAAKVWTPEVDLTKVNGYFLKTQVTRVGRRSSLPTTRLLEDGRANWTNRLKGKTLYVDRVTREDLRSRNDVEDQIVQGYYYDEGRNDRILEVIEECFQERLKLKALGNPLADVYKIILVSSYGKMGQTAVEKQVQVFSREGSPGLPRLVLPPYHTDRRHGERTTPR
jgi:hypothetical protein